MNDRFNNIMIGLTDSAGDTGRGSYSGDAFVTTSYLDDYIVRGNIFDITLAPTLTAATAVYFTSEILEASQDSVNAAFLLPLSLVPVDGYTIMNIYEDTEYTGGTTLTPVNRNRTSTRTSLSTAKTDASGTTKGDLRWTYIFGAASAPQGGSGGGIGFTSNSIILDKTKRYLYELTNSETAVVGIVAEFAEI